MVISFVYVVVTLLVISALVWLVEAVWMHEINTAFVAFGFSLIMTGVFVNLVVWTYSPLYSWANLPSWTYDAPLMIGTATVICAGLISMVNARQKKMRKSAEEVSPSTT